MKNNKNQPPTLNDMFTYNKLKSQYLYLKKGGDVDMSTQDYTQKMQKDFLDVLSQIASSKVAQPGMNNMQRGGNPYDYMQQEEISPAWKQAMGFRGPDPEYIKSINKNGENIYSADADFLGRGKGPIYSGAMVQGAYGSDPDNLTPTDWRFPDKIGIQKFQRGSEYLSEQDGVDINRLREVERQRQLQQRQQQRDLDMQTYPDSQNYLPNQSPEDLYWQKIAEQNRAAASQSMQDIIYQRNRQQDRDPSAVDYTVPEIPQKIQQGFEPPFLYDKSSYAPGGGASMVGVTDFPLLPDYLDPGNAQYIQQVNQSIDQQRALLGRNAERAFYERNNPSIQTEEAAQAAAAAQTIKDPAARTTARSQTTTGTNAGTSASSNPSTPANSNSPASTASEEPKIEIVVDPESGEEIVAETDPKTGQVMYYGLKQYKKDRRGILGLGRRTDTYNFGLFDPSQSDSVAASTPEPEMSKRQLRKQERFDRTQDPEFNREIDQMLYKAPKDNISPTRIPYAYPGQPNNVGTVGNQFDDVSPSGYARGTKEYMEEAIRVGEQMQQRKQGGQNNPYLNYYMQQGGEFYLSDEEIEQLRAMGANIEFLD
jgi:hypothetical protein